MCRTLDECSKKLNGGYFFNYSLKKLGMKENCIGYFYVIEILKELINKDRNVRSFSREIYPIVAERYNRSESTVERDIRTCISKQWENNLKDKLSKYWVKDRAPSCRQFIFILKRFIMEQIS